jgi:hypothetical protein
MSLLHVSLNYPGRHIITSSLARICFLVFLKLSKYYSVLTPLSLSPHPEGKTGENIWNMI